MTTGTHRTGRISGWIYRRLLWVYPRRVRERWAPQLVEAFERDHERAGGRPGAVLLFWARTVADLAKAGLLERFGRDPGRRRLPPASSSIHQDVFSMLPDLLADLRFSLRTLARAPWYTVVTLVILALGIGANTTIFTVVDTVFLSDAPHVAEPGRLVRLTRTRGASVSGSVSFPDYEHYRDNALSFSGVLGYDDTPMAVSVRHGEDLRQLRGALVSANYFDVLGVPMEAGRGFREDEGRAPGSAAVAVVSHGYWRQALAGAADAVGRTIRVNGHPFVVVGIAPEGFRGVSPVEAPPDLWMPMTMYPVLSPTEADFFGRVEGEVLRWVYPIARLRPGVSVEQAQAEASGLAAYLAENFSQWNAESGIRVSSDYAFLPADRDALLRVNTMLGIVAMLVLAVACANVALLQLSRVSVRTRELSMRVALGAGRGRLIRQMLAESMVLGLGGGVLGFALAFWSADFAAALIPMSFSVGFNPSGPVLAFSLVLAVASSIVFGVGPTWRVARTPEMSALRVGRSGRGWTTLRSVLVAAQVALSIVLVSGALLFARSVRSARSVDLGFDAENRLLIGMDLRNHGYDPERGMQFVHDATDRIASLPGVLRVSTVRMTPFRGSWQGSIYPEGQTSEEPQFVGFNRIGPGYFSVMATPLLDGRDFAMTDDADAPPVLIVNEALAERFWPGQRAVGRVLERGDNTYTVIGVARNAVYYEVGEDPEPQVFVPLSQWYGPNVNFLVQVAGDPLMASLAVQRTLHDINPDIAFIAVRTLQEVFDDEIGTYRVAATMVSLFGLLALFLAAAGLYGVLSYLVAQRTREIGIQVALGASQGRVARGVMGRGLRLTVLGSVVGVAGALAGSRYIASFVFGVSPQDPATFLAAPIILSLVACVAGFLPARRAARVDPLVALQSE